MKIDDAGRCFISQPPTPKNVALQLGAKKIRRRFDTVIFFCCVRIFPTGKLSKKSVVAIVPESFQLNFYFLGRTHLALEFL